MTLYSYTDRHNRTHGCRSCNGRLRFTLVFQLLQEDLPFLVLPLVPLLVAPRDELLLLLHELLVSGHLLLIYGHLLLMDGHLLVGVILLFLDIALMPCNQAPHLRNILLQLPQRQRLVETEYPLPRLLRARPPLPLALGCLDNRRSGATTATRKRLAAPPGSGLRARQCTRTSLPVCRS